jgi:hypothetical protein
MDNNGNIDEVDWKMYGSTFAKIYGSLITILVAIFGQANINMLTQNAYWIFLLGIISIIITFVYLQIKKNNNASAKRIKDLLSTTQEQANKIMELINSAQLVDYAHKTDVMDLTLSNKVKDELARLGLQLNSAKEQEIITLVLEQVRKQMNPTVTATCGIVMKDYGGAITNTEVKKDGT